MKPEECLVLERYLFSRHGTFGRLVYDDEEICDTLEPTNLDNARNHGIPDGTYELDVTYSPKFGTALPLVKVPGRVGIRIHAGNKLSDTRGCILVGDRFGFTLFHSLSIVNLIMRLLQSNPKIKYLVVYTQSLDSVQKTLFYNE